MEHLAQYNECTGCTACLSICPQNCIRMDMDEYGFLYPKVDYDRCVSCNTCVNICPIKKPFIIGETKTKAYAAYSLNETLRLKSSSGGVFSELAIEVLNRDGLVYGAVYDQQYTVSHACVTNEKGLERIRGAKYAQSILGDCFREIRVHVQQGRQVLFSGTPCQVAGLKSFLRNDYANLICIDFVCHGVPSPIAWQNYVKYRAEQDDQGKLPQMINQRSKVSGWSHYRYSNFFEYPDGNIYMANSGEDLFMKMYIANCLSRKSCGQCHYKGYSRISDITLGDFWGIWDLVPEMDDDKGTSVLLVHSDCGEQLLSSVKGNLKIKEVSLTDASQQNPSLIRSSYEHQKRDLILLLLNEGKISMAEREFNKNNQIPYLRRIKNILRRIIEQ